jgi:hypothetical protein
MSEGTRLQVQIRVLGPDGEWYVPAYQPAAVLAALEAVRLDIQELSGSYPPGKLREIRDAAQSLVTAVSALVRTEAAS